MYHFEKIKEVHQSYFFLDFFFVCIGCRNVGNKDGCKVAWKIFSRILKWCHFLPLIHWNAKFCNMSLHMIYKSYLITRLFGKLSPGKLWKNSPQKIYKKNTFFLTFWLLAPLDPPELLFVGVRLYIRLNKSVVCGIEFSINSAKATVVELPEGILLKKN